METHLKYSRYQPHRGGQTYIFRLAYKRLSEEEARKSVGRWTSFCFCHRPLIPVKVETIYRGVRYGYFEWQSLCYACGLPPELCTCPAIPMNGFSKKLWLGLCEPSLHRQIEGSVITQTTFERFNGDPVFEEESQDNRQVPLDFDDPRRTSYPSLPAEKFQ